MFVFNDMIEKTILLYIMNYTHQFMSRISHMFMVFNQKTSLQILCTKRTHISFTTLRFIVNQ